MLLYLAPLREWVTIKTVPLSVSGVTYDVPIAGSDGRIHKVSTQHLESWELTVNAVTRWAAVTFAWPSLVVIMCSCAEFDSRPNGTIIPIDGYVGAWRLVTEEGDLEIEINDSGGVGTLSYSAQFSDPTRNMTETQNIELRQVNNLTIAIIEVYPNRNEFYKLEMLDEDKLHVYRINNEFVKEYVTNGVFVEQPPDNVFGFEGIIGTITGSPVEIADFVQKPDAFIAQYSELERVIVAENDKTLWRSEPARIVCILGGTVLVAVCAGYIMTRRPAAS